MDSGGSSAEKWCDQVLFEERTCLEDCKIRFVELVMHCFQEFGGQHYLRGLRFSSVAITWMESLSQSSCKFLVMLMLQKF